MQKNDFSHTAPRGIAEQCNFQVVYCRRKIFAFKRAASSELNLIDLNVDSGIKIFQGQCGVLILDETLRGTPGVVVKILWDRVLPVYAGLKDV